MPTLCDRYNFDRNKIDRRLAFLKLSKADHAWAQRLQSEVISPSISNVIDRFYEGLLFQKESRKWLLDGGVIAKLKKSQSQYLLSLGIAFDSEDYFEERLKIGVVHASIGLPLSTYQCAYGNLIQCIFDLIPENIRQHKQDFAAITSFIVKITSLDMSLATETYHQSFMSDLEDEVKMASLRESHLRTQVEMDPLTGLLNRASVFERLTNAIHNAQVDAGKFCLLMLDIDHFKKVNDTYGHQVGDEIITQVASAISKTLREKDIAGRYGGEEFIIGLTGVGAECGEKIANRICKDLANSPIMANSQPLNLTVSIGLTSLKFDDDLQAMIRRADKALYSAKGAGRNRVDANFTSDES